MKVKLSYLFLPEPCRREWGGGGGEVVLGPFCIFIVAPVRSTDIFVLNRKSDNGT